MWQKSFVYVCSVVLVLVGLGMRSPEVRAQGIIKLGNLVDLTGPTSDPGKDISQGRCSISINRAVSTAGSLNW